MQRKRRRTSSDQRGQALVEFLLIMPVLIALLAGIFEFTWYISNHDVVAQAARASAEIAANEGAVTPDAYNAVTATIKGGGYPAANITSVAVTLTPGQGVPETYTATGPGGFNTPSACLYTNNQPISSQQVSVTVTYHYHLLFPFLDSPLFLGLGHFLATTITSTATLPAQTAWLPGISGPTMLDGTVATCP